MQFIKWLDIYELGIPPIDFQHKNLIFILNDTYRAFFMREEKEKLIGEVLDNFIQFYTEHFKTEEKFMEFVDYPMLYHHKNLHKEILNKLYEYKKQFIEVEGVYLEEFLNLLNNWVFEHLTIEDMKIKDHISYIDEEVLQNYIDKLE